MSTSYAPASPTSYGALIGQRRRARRSPSYSQSRSGAAGSDAEVEMVRFGIQLIVDGELDVDNGASIAARLGVTHRHLRRMFQTHAGITPDQLARSRRAYLALRMLDDTDLPVADIVLATGFGSIRQFNRTMYDVFRVTPLSLRARRRRGERLVTDGGLVVRLGSCSEVAWDCNVANLASQSIAGVAVIDGDAYRRTVLIDGDVGALEVRRDRTGDVLMRAILPHWKDLFHVIQSTRRTFNLDTHFARTANGD